MSFVSLSLPVVASSFSSLLSGLGLYQPTDMVENPRLLTLSYWLLIGGFGGDTTRTELMLRLLLGTDPAVWSNFFNRFRRR